MSCEEIRECIGADPQSLSAQVQAHVDSCPECREWQAQMQGLDARIRQALLLDPQKLGIERRGRVVAMPDRSPVPGRRTWYRGLSIAGSLAAGLLVAMALWVSRPSPSLASEVVTHVEGEPDSWHRTEPVAGSQLAGVLRITGVKLGPGMSPVVYASSCRFRGHLVPHLVVRTPSGPVTVMILEHEHVKGNEPFKEDGFTGLLVPAPQGSVAILSRTPMALEQPAAEVLRALESANQPPEAANRLPEAGSR